MSEQQRNRILDRIVALSWATLQKACMAAQFEANPAGCPPASIVGHAKAVTPILPVPLEGPAYFVSHGGAKFPELIIVLQGYGVTLDLHGETFISKAGITSSTFRTVPDDPIGSFELTLPEGTDSALAANGNLCAVTKTILVKRKETVRVKGHNKTVTRRLQTTLPGSLVMPTAFTAPNGMVIKQNTPIDVTGCAKTKKKAKGSVRDGHGRDALGEPARRIAVELVHAGLRALANEGRAAQLGEEHGERVLARDPVAGLDEQVIPSPVVQRVRAPAGQQERDGGLADRGRGGARREPCNSCATLSWWPPRSTRTSCTTCSTRR